MFEGFYKLETAFGACQVMERDHDWNLAIIHPVRKKLKFNS
jgi:hypothetical protein